jgi:hypothetical protein
MKFVTLIFIIAAICALPVYADDDRNWAERQIDSFSKWLDNVADRAVDTTSSAVERNAQTAEKVCGTGHVEQVTIEGFSCKSSQDTTSPAKDTTSPAKDTTSPAK